MPQYPTLYGKTFDQQMLAGVDHNSDLSPNRRIPAEIVFEPVGSGIRVTARDESHAVLWGFIGSKGMLADAHGSIAVYTTLKELINEELAKWELPVLEKEDSATAAQDAIRELEDTVKWLKRSLNVKKASEATKERARSIARIVADANKQIDIEASSLKGMKSRNDQLSDSE
jgi:hypothetical protein